MLLHWPPCDTYCAFFRVFQDACWDSSGFPLGLKEFLGIGSSPLLFLNPGAFQFGRQRQEDTHCSRVGRRGLGFLCVCVCVCVLLSSFSVLDHFATLRPVILTCSWCLPSSLVASSCVCFWGSPGLRWTILGPCALSFLLWYHGVFWSRVKPQPWPFLW